MLKYGEYWDEEEMLQEQLYFMTTSGKVVPVTHRGTDKPYYAWELAKAWAYKNYDKLQKERLKTLKRKRAFSDEELKKLYDDYKQGIGVVELSKKYKKDRKTIRKYLNIAESNLK